MSAEPKQAKKGGKFKKLIMIIGGTAVLLGAGAAAGVYASGGSHEEKPHEDPDAPKLVAKDGKEEAHGPAKPGDMSRYKATYLPLEQNFTSNLRDSDGFVQVGLGISTYYDTKMTDAIKDNEMPIRSAVLMVLADQDGMVLSTPTGKERLQKSLTQAINEVLEEKTGYAGVDSVYFTSFIIQ